VFVDSRVEEELSEKYIGGWGYIIVRSMGGVMGCADYCSGAWLGSIDSILGGGVRPIAFLAT
jgi:hypothetical protein